MSTETNARAFELLHELRAAGWAVAVHNDYRQGDKPMTFWLFTRRGQCIKGEAETDATALWVASMQAYNSDPPIVAHPGHAPSFPSLVAPAGPLPQGQMAGSGEDEK